MTTKYLNYTLTQQAFGFDLTETIVSQKKGNGSIKEPKGEFYNKEISHGYNMQLENAVKKIVHLELLKNNSVVELNVFIDEYKKLVEKIENAVKL